MHDNWLCWCLQRAVPVGLSPLTLALPLNPLPPHTAATPIGLSPLVPALSPCPAYPDPPPLLSAHGGMAHQHRDARATRGGTMGPFRRGISMEPLPERGGRGVPSPRRVVCPPIVHSSSSLLRHSAGGIAGSTGQPTEQFHWGLSCRSARRRRHCHAGPRLPDLCCALSCAQCLNAYVRIPPPGRGGGGIRPCNCRWRAHWHLRVPSSLTERGPLVL